MNATLYLPEQPPRKVNEDGFVMPDASTGFARVPEQVAALLECQPWLVDVLASGPSYVAYSIFDSEGEVNYTAMAAVSEVSGTVFNDESDDTTLRGAVLLVLAN